MTTRPAPAWTLRGRQGPGTNEGPTMTVDSHEAATPPSELGRLLVDSKFAVPQPRPGVVSRASLVQTARLSDCRVVTITAPAGYGKSIFLAEWAAAEDRRVAWVSLDHLDNDPSSLLVS